MKRSIYAVIVLALIFALGGCGTLKPFTQEEIDRLSMQVVTLDPIAVRTV